MAAASKEAGSITQVMSFTRQLADVAGAGLRFHLGAFSGKPRVYEIHPGYRHRDHIKYFDDMDNTDEWQKEVYKAARALMQKHNLRTVHDVGCGSGYKLVHILGKFETIGIDLPQTIDRVRLKYPKRQWIGRSFDEVEVPKADMVICSDVIEHVADPDALMRFLVRVSKGYVVVSTPDREMEYDWQDAHRYGPPRNVTHVREWNMPELKRYVSRFLDVERQEITNVAQATQMIIARPKG